MFVVLIFLLLGTGVFVTWKELEAKHNFEKIRLNESFMAVAVQKAYSVTRRSIMALCFIGASIVAFCVLYPESAKESFKLLATIAERVMSPR